MEPTIKLSRHASLPLILSIPVALLGGIFTVLFLLIALIPDGLDGEMRTLGIIFYSFLLPFLFIAVPLMSFLLRRSNRNIAIFERGAVSFSNERYELSHYDLVYYPICLHSYLRYRPGLLALRQIGWAGLSEEDLPKEIEVGCFTKGEIMRIVKLGLIIHME